MQENAKIKENEEYQYLQLIKDILDDGHKETTRNGTTFSLFGRTMRFSLKDNKIPILTTFIICFCLPVRLLIITKIHNVLTLYTHFHIYFFTHFIIMNNKIRHFIIIYIFTHVNLNCGKFKRYIFQLFF